MQIYIEFMLLFFTLFALSDVKCIHHWECCVIFISHSLYIIFHSFQFPSSFQKLSAFSQCYSLWRRIISSTKKDKRWKINRFFRKKSSTLYISPPSRAFHCYNSFSVENWFHFFVTCSRIWKKNKWERRRSEKLCVHRCCHTCRKYKASLGDYVEYLYKIWRNLKSRSSCSIFCLNLAA